MLVLSRKKNQTVVIDGQYEVTILDIIGGRVRIGFKAPRDVTIHRAELQAAIDAQQVGSAGVVAGGDERAREAKRLV